MVKPIPVTRPQDVVVLIPTLNEEAHIGAVLDALMADAEFAQNCRVIVADGGSTDGTRAVVEQAALCFDNARLVDNPGRTQAHAMNLLLGDAFADASVFIRCDAHAAYPPDFLRRLVLALDERPDAASIVIPMDSVVGELCFQRGLAFVADSKLGAGGSAHRGGAASGYVEHGHHAAFRAEVFRHLNGYDASFVANEDAEYDRRVVNAGHRVWLEADIRIGYFPRNRLSRLWRQYFRYGEGRARTCLKHGVWPRLRQSIPLINTGLIIASLGIIPFNLMGVFWPAFYLSVLALFAVTTALRHRSRCGLVALPALATMHTAWGLGFLNALFDKALTRLASPRREITP